MARAKQPYFQFKKFKVWHQQSALKVCTEACILGAYISLQSHQKALDIGTGTGVLALMMAQRNSHLTIDAIEIDSQTAEEANKNVTASPFASQIKIYHTSLQNFDKEIQYDLIISNPPFFNNHLLSVQPIRNQALHTHTLSFEELVAGVDKFLTPNGKFLVLLPPYETQLLTTLCYQKGLHATRQLQIFQQEGKPLFRLITTFEHSNQSCLIEKLNIYQTHQTYTPDFQDLLKEYYL